MRKPYSPVGFLERFVALEVRAAGLIFGAAVLGVLLATFGDFYVHNSFTELISEIAIGGFFLLDLATDSDIILRTVPKAGKARYTIQTSARTISPIASKYCPERNQKIAASRSVRTMQEIAHSNNIYWLTTLTFRDETELNKAKELFVKFKRTKRMQPFSPYISVLEGWEKGERTHLHLLVNKQTAQKLKTHWPHGTVDTRLVPWEELDNVCKYMGKKFADINRPKGSRYTASKGIKPKTESHYFKNTIDSYKHLLDTAEGKDLSNNWSYNNGFGRGGEIIWNPNNTQIE